MRILKQIFVTKFRPLFTQEQSEFIHLKFSYSEIPIQENLLLEHTFLIYFFLKQ